MTWDELDWSILERLRGRFLSNAAAAGPYWESADDLANYDYTYGERIGWKWDHVLRELRLRNWRPRARTVFDWGCGSGVAARRVIAGFGPENFDALTVWDHSPLACDYAAATAQQAFPALTLTQATPGLLAAPTPIGLLVVSHVLNELPPDALAALQALIARADAVLWVEPGTHVVSRQLSALRDDLRATFQIVAPCTHANPCPVLTPGNERHWCHFFAPPPPEIFADSNWVKFGQRAGIDLRSLPYCFIAAERDDAGGTPALPGLSRVIGRVEHYKPYARWLNCDASGLVELELPKRADSALFKQLERTKAPLVYRWHRDSDKVTGGESLG
ncbi:small ribosomal subunit Rsm22 family protein [Horticoccus sp. 23ND18S-11]|uniref:small ribosomal subunit Rsm22 family protein n=1 Tax=Horticoccus sp. 23ND18S-11 TaxID=3391832 RepID=UPI0039C9E769